MVGCSGQENATGVPPALAVTATDTRPKIVVLGDSLTAGLGLASDQAFPGLLQDQVNRAGFSYEVVNAGVSGDTSAGGLRRVDGLLKDDVRVLIVALGANDGLRGLPVVEMKQNLSRAIEAARQKGAVVVLAGMEAPPNYGAEYATSFRQAFRDLSREHRVVFMPFLLDKVAGQASLNQGDGIHPNAEGAATIAGTVWTVLRPILGEMSGS